MKDVVVIGAGPAGLCAAIRVRWIKTHRGVPCSVVLWDPAHLGGLARFRSTKLSGPGFHLQGKKLIQHFEEDLLRYEIPVQPYTLQRITPHNSLWQLHGVTPEGEATTLTSRSVIFATGLRQLCNELEYFGKGVLLSYNGFDFLPQILTQSFQQNPCSELTIIGNSKTRNIIKLLKHVLSPQVQLTFILDKVGEPQDIHVYPGNVIYGRLGQCYGDSYLQEIEIKAVDAASQKHTCSRVLIDYMAFENEPEFHTELEGLCKTREGFVEVNRHMQTNLPGIFAAGDITGSYAMVSKAMGEGVTAGFEAYRYVYEQKFSTSAPLYAYASLDQELDPEVIDYPELRPSDHIEVLSPQKLPYLDPPVAGWKALLPHTKTSLEMLAQRMNSHEEACAYAYWLLDQKVITIQPKEKGTRALASRSSLESPSV